MNNWIKFVKEYSMENDIPYKQALTECKSLYQEMKGGSVNSDIVARIMVNNPSKFDPNKIKNKSENILNSMLQKHGNKKKVEKLKIESYHNKLMILLQNLDVLIENYKNDKTVKNYNLIKLTKQKYMSYKWLVPKDKRTIQEYH